MSQQNTSAATESTSTAGSATSKTGAASPATVDDRGTTGIADVVVSKIAGIATREVGGVYEVGGNTARMVGALRERIPGARTNVSQGVSVEVGESQAAVDISLVAEYGVAIHELADVVRENVVAAVEGMTGLEVTEVNIMVSDVHLPGDEEDDSRSEQPRQVESRPRVR